MFQDTSYSSSSSLNQQITTSTKTMFHTSNIGAQQKKKKTSEKVTKKNIEKCQNSVASMTANVQN